MTTTTAADTCTRSRAGRITCSLLGYGVLAGPFYLVVGGAQALTRDGFDPTQHSWSLLANGHLGWIQIANFLLTGAMVLAAAVGLARAGVGTPWVPRLVGGFGLALLVAGVLRADPAQGFPVGTPAGNGTVTWHGVGHLVAAGIGFLCVVAASLVLASRYAADGRRGWAWYSRISGLVFLASFVGIAVGGARPLPTLSFIAGLTVIWVWLAAVCADRYRTVV
jgi:hypothetical protein